MFILYFSSPRTIGKRWAKIAVINKKGQLPNSLDMVIRAVFYLPDIFLSFGALAMITVYRDSLQRRLGDLIANTVVVKVPTVRAPSEFDFNIENSHSITYPEIKNLPEELLLLVKEALMSYYLYPNQAHLEILENTAQKIAHILHMNTAPENSKLFLQTIVKDYIMLTR